MRGIFRAPESPFGLFKRDNFLHNRAASVHASFKTSARRISVATNVMQPPRYLAALVRRLYYECLDLLVEPIYHRKHTVDLHATTFARAA
jgi:hypothetical protein